MAVTSLAVVLVLVIVLVVAATLLVRAWKAGKPSSKQTCTSRPRPHCAPPRALGAEHATFEFQTQQTPALVVDLANRVAA